MITRVEFIQTPDSAFSDFVVRFFKGKIHFVSAYCKKEHIKTSQCPLLLDFSLDIYHDGLFITLNVSKRVFDAVNLELSK